MWSGRVVEPMASRLADGLFYKPITCLLQFTLIQFTSSSRYRIFVCVLAWYKDCLKMKIIITKH